MGQIEDVGSGLRNAINNDRQLPWNGLLNISRNDPQNQHVLKLMTQRPYVSIDMRAILVSFHADEIVRGYWSIDSWFNRRVSKDGRWI